MLYIVLPPVAEMPLNEIVLPTLGINVKKKNSLLSAAAAALAWTQPFPPQAPPAAVPAVVNAAPRDKHGEHATLASRDAGVNGDGP
jgi:hypothetical protein